MLKHNYVQENNLTLDNCGFSGLIKCGKTSCTVKHTFPIKWDYMCNKNWLLFEWKLWRFSSSRKTKYLDQLCVHVILLLDMSFPLSKQ